MTRWLTSPLSVIGISLCTGCLQAAESPRVLGLGTQKVGQTTYFQVRLERPANLRLPTFDTSKPFSEADRRKFAAFPRLVPQDDRTRAVYYRHKPSQPGLSFCGQVIGDGKSRFELVYPTGEAVGGEPPALSLSKMVQLQGTAQTPVQLDFTTAKVVPVPAVDPDDQHVHRDDLRSHWALYQAAHFAVLET